MSKVEVVVVLDKAERDRLIELHSEVKALPYEMQTMHMYDRAIVAHRKLMRYKAYLLDKYFPNPRQQFEEELFGDWGYDFDSEAGCITREIE